MKIPHQPEEQERSLLDYLIAQSYFHKMDHSRSVEVEDLTYDDLARYIDATQSNSEEG